MVEVDSTVDSKDFESVIKKVFKEHQIKIKSSSKKNFILHINSLHKGVFFEPIEQ